MEEQLSNTFNPMDKVQDSAIPDDSITIIIKCGGRTYFKGVNLEDSQEETAKVATVLMQAVIDTVDAKGLKAGGSLYDPSNPQNSGKVEEAGDK